MQLTVVSEGNCGTDMNRTFTWELSATERAPIGNERPAPTDQCAMTLGGAMRSKDCFTRGNPHPRSWVYGRPEGFRAPNFKSFSRSSPLSSGLKPRRTAATPVATGAAAEVPVNAVLASV